MREVNISTQYGKVYGQAAGAAGESLVLGVHGWSKRNGWHTWAPLLQPLGQAGFHAVSVDMPGWGNSPAWSAAQMDADTGVKALWEIITRLNSERASLMGKSWGGGIALEFALRHPNMVSSLILSAPAYRDFDRLKRLKQTVLLVWSKDDPVIPYRYSSSFQEVIPESSLVTYESGGHSAAPMNASDFAPLAIEFLLGAIGKR